MAKYDTLPTSCPGLSETMLRDHIALYHQYRARWDSVVSLHPTQDQALEERVEGLVDQKAAALDLQPVGTLKGLLDTVDKELKTRGIQLDIDWQLGASSTFFSSYGSRTVSVPWYLATPSLWELATRIAPTALSRTAVLEALRHEAAHAVAGTYRLGETTLYTTVFGDDDQPYPDVDNANYDSLIPQANGIISSSSSAPPNYGAVHPSEKFAEAFGLWLSGSDVELGAEQKRLYNAIETLVHQYVVGKRPVLRRGRIPTWRQLKGTVGEALGLFHLPLARFEGDFDAWSEHLALKREEPWLYSAIRLHEAYFDRLGRGASQMTESFQRHLSEVYGSVHGYLHDLTTTAAAAGVGWAAIVWEPQTHRVWNVPIRDHATAVPVGCQLLAAIDMWEHAYAPQYRTRKDLYLQAVFANWDWEGIALPAVLG